MSAPQPTSSADGYYAQHGEDRWLEAYFRDRKPGVFVEVGAYDGVYLSNTYRLEQLGWRGVLVEPDPEKAARCRASRPSAQVFECACLAPGGPPEVTFYRVPESDVLSTATLTEYHDERLRSSGMTTIAFQVPARTLQSVLEQAGFPSVDLITIDVEEGELAVLQGLDLLRWHPSVVMVESNSRWRKDEIRDYFTACGYVFLRSIVINDIYVPIADLPSMTRAIDALLYAARFQLPKLAHELPIRARMAAGAVKQRLLGRRR